MASVKISFCTCLHPLSFRGYWTLPRLILVVYVYNIHTVHSRAHPAHDFHMTGMVFLWCWHHCISDCNKPIDPFLPPQNSSVSSVHPLYVWLHGCASACQGRVEKVPSSRHQLVRMCYRNPSNEWKVEQHWSCDRPGKLVVDFEFRIQWTIKPQMHAFSPCPKCFLL